MKDTNLTIATKLAWCGAGLSLVVLVGTFTVAHYPYHWILVASVVNVLILLYLYLTVTDL